MEQYLVKRGGQGLGDRGGAGKRWKGAPNRRHLANGKQLTDIVKRGGGGGGGGGGVGGGVETREKKKTTGGE